VNCAEQSRRDDLEALGYVLLYLLKGSLPWQGLKAQNKTSKYEVRSLPSRFLLCGLMNCQRIAEKKLSTTVDVLCKGLPPEFTTYINYCKSLRFEDTPDYAFLRKLLRDVFIRERYEYDCVFDWDLIPIAVCPSVS
jgi:hypothetical protein